jgi:hypothetical protein
MDGGEPPALSTCDEELPLLPIMRQFDFGQFVFLHQQPETSEPRWRGDVSKRIVLDASGRKNQALQDWLERKQASKVTGPKQPSDPPIPRAVDLGGISLSLDGREAGSSVV